MVGIDPEPQLAQWWDAADSRHAEHADPQGRPTADLLGRRQERRNRSVRIELFRWSAGGWKVNAELPGTAGSTAHPVSSSPRTSRDRSRAVTTYRQWSTRRGSSSTPATPTSRSSRSAATSSTGSSTRLPICCRPCGRCNRHSWRPAADGQSRMRLPQPQAGVHTGAASAVVRQVRRQVGAGRAHRARPAPLRRGRPFRRRPARPSGRCPGPRRRVADDHPRGADRGGPGRSCVIRSSQCPRPPVAELVLLAGSAGARGVAAPAPSTRSPSRRPAWTPRPPPDRLVSVPPSSRRAAVGQRRCRRRSAESLAAQRGRAAGGGADRCRRGRLLGRQRLHRTHPAPHRCGGRPAPQRPLRRPRPARRRCDPPLLSGGGRRRRRGDRWRAAGRARRPAQPARRPAPPAPAGCRGTRRTPP